MKKARSVKVLRVAIFGLAAVILLTFAFSQKLSTKEYTEKTDKVTGNIKIMVLSDLHDTCYGQNQKELTEIVKKEAPDIILFTGDIFDDEIQTGDAVKLLEEVGESYPCYYVSGNHEFWSGKIDDIKKQVRDLGVKVLEGTSDVVRVNNQYLRICGIDDPEVGTEEWNGQIAKCEEYLGDNIYTVLMTHRPEMILRYHEYDLIVSGHTHGGMLRIPYILNGIYAPGQGWLPEYAGGRYEFEDKIMIVSRGLSKNWVPRIFNPPEVVVINVETIQ